jgi:signal recognition particle subunit SEC65
MDYVLARRPGAVTMADVDWRKLGAVLSARRPRPLVSQLAAAGKAIGEPADSSWLDALRELPREEAIERIEQKLIEHLAGVLGARVEDIDSYRGFMEMGMNSIMAVELSRRLTEIAGRKLPATLAFEHPNVHDLAIALARDLLPAPPEVAPPKLASDEQATETRADLEGLTDQQLARMLADRLDQPSTTHE